jgi:hypothetical protein
MLKSASATGILCAAFALTNLWSRAGSAQQHDPAAAQGLFDQARELSRQGRYAEACPKLLESNRLDPGIGTQFHLADCYEKSGKIAAAWATFLDVASQARAQNQPEREKAAAQRAIQIEPRLPQLTLQVPDSSQRPGLEIQRDGILVGTVQWGTPVPVDPGPHELTLKAPGYKTVSVTLKLEEGKKLDFDVPALEKDEPVSNPPSVAPPALAPAPSAAEPASLVDSHRSTSKSTVDAWPVVLGSAALVGLGVGTGFALKADSTNKKSKTDCDSSNANVCGATGLSQRRDALAQGTVATVGFIGAGVLLIAAGVVWGIEAHSSHLDAAASRAIRASASVTPGNAAFYLQGEF